MLSVNDFGGFWAVYPARDGRKRGKSETFEQWKKMDEKDYLSIIEAAKHYAQDEQVKRGFAKDPVRFLKRDYWRDFLDPVAKVCRFRSLTPCEHLSEEGTDVCTYHRLYRQRLNLMRAKESP